MLRCVTTPYEASERVSQLIKEAGMKSLADDPPEPDDEVDAPTLKLPDYESVK
ncbi:hypothetical protein D3C84_1257030 [compost metagenome]